MSEIPRNSDGSYTLYSAEGMTVTLRFPADPEAGFMVVTKDVSGNLPTEYTWLLNFGVQNRAGRYLPSVSYTLQGSVRPDGRNWFVFYNDRPNPLNGTHTSPGDPPIGYG